MGEATKPCYVCNRPASTMVAGRYYCEGHERPPVLSYAAGAAAERARIVAWLRREKQQWHAQRIERGEHAKDAEEGT